MKITNVATFFEGNLSYLEKTINLWATRNKFKLLSTSLAQANGGWAAIVTYESETGEN